MDAPHLNDLIASRRAVLGALAGLPLLNLPAAAAAPGHVGFAGIGETNADTITLPPGYSWRTLIAWGDALFEGAPDFDPDALTRADQERRFGTHNDMLALFPGEAPGRHLLCANHEYISLELMFPALRNPATLTPAQLEAAIASIGVSVVELEHAGNAWRAVRNGAPGAGRNRRITPFTPVRFTGPGAAHAWIEAAARVVNAAEPGAAPGEIACGTLANCAGGVTPWGTYLTAEENFDDCFLGAPADLSDPAYALDASSFGYPHYDAIIPEALAPRQFRLAENPHGPALYGWVTEIDPYDPASTPKKRTALGRKKNECATTALTANGRVAVYMGDDQRNEHVYKFVSRRRFDPANRAANMDLLDEGQLYAARFDADGAGRWLALSAARANAAARAQGSPIRFHNEADVLMRVREAARLLGATPMDRPEDVEAVCDATGRGLGPVLIVCTNNSERGFARPGNPRRESERPDTAQNNLAGHILRIDEAGGDCAALSFRWDVFAMGGDPSADAFTIATRAGAPAHISTLCDGAPTISGDRFACPDNICIDSAQRLWISTDGNDSVFAACNDSVLVAPIGAPAPRLVSRFLVGPVGAEICGPVLSRDERAFFCALQHPGANDVAGAPFWRTRWEGAPPPSSFPDGAGAWPRSAVIVVTRDDGGRIGD